MFKNVQIFPEFQYLNPIIVRPSTIGHELVATEDYIWDNKKPRKGDSDLCFIQYTISGAGMVRFNDKETRLEPGMGFICLTNHPYRYWFDKKIADNWEFYWLSLYGKTAQELMGSIQKEFGKAFSLPLQGIAINTLKEIFQKTKKKEWKNQTHISVTLYQFILQIIEELRNRGTQDAKERLDQALAYIRDHYTESLDISTLSQRFGYTREHFTRLYRHKMGITPGQYILELRINRAKELLRTTRRSLTDIANESGFQEANYLCRLFRKRCGMSPREYQTSSDR